MHLDPKRTSNLDRAMDRALTELELRDVSTEEYARTLDHVVKLQKMKREEEDALSISPNTLITVGANLLGIFLILKHEKLDIITSKAMSFVLKPRS